MSYDRMKSYKKLIFSENRSQLWTKDLNHTFDILKDETKLVSSRLHGISYLPLDGTGVPVPNIPNPVDKVTLNPSFVKSGKYEFNLDGNDLKYRYNNGAWSATTPVVKDSVTVNRNVFSIGFDFIFNAVAVGIFNFGFIVSECILSRGGDFEYTGVPGELKIFSSEFLIKGEWFYINEQTLAGISDGDILYIQITPSTIDYTTDVVLEHYLGDGKYSPNPPTALKYTQTIHTCAFDSLPTDGTNWILPIAILNSAGGVISATPIFETAINFAEIARTIRMVYGQKRPPVPSGLAVLHKTGIMDTGSKQDKGVKDIEGASSCLISCSPSSDTDFYEFRVQNDYATYTDYQYYKVQHVDGVTPSFSIPFLRAGIPFRVSVRGVDKFGNASFWSSTVTTTSGGVCSLTSYLDYNLKRADSKEGFWINLVGFSVPQVNPFGFTVYTKEGAAPTENVKDLICSFRFQDVVDENENFFIPWDGVNPHVIIIPFDTKGVYYNGFPAVPTMKTLDFTESAVPNVDLGPVFSLSKCKGNEAVRVSVTDYHVNTKEINVYSWTTGSGETPKEITFVKRVKIPEDVMGVTTFSFTIDLDSGREVDVALKSVDAWGIEQTNYLTSSIDIAAWRRGVYRVGASTGSHYEFSSVQSTINHINSLVGISREFTIEIYPDTYTENITLPVGFAHRLRIVGMNNPTIVGNLDVTRVLGITDEATGLYNTYPRFTLIVENLNVTGRVIKADRGLTGVISLYNVLFRNVNFKDTSVNPIVENIQTSVGSNVNHNSLFVFEKCTFYSPTTKAEMFKFRPVNPPADTSGASFVFNNCIIAAGECTNACFDVEDDNSVSGADWIATRQIINCSIQNDVVTDYIISGTGAVLFVANRIYCRTLVVGLNEVAQINNASVNITFGFETGDIVNERNTNVFIPSEFLVKTEHL